MPVRNDDPVPLIIDLLNPKSIGFKDYYCVKFQVIPIRDQGFFCFIMPTYTPTNIQCNKVTGTAISTLVYYVTGADNN